MAGSEVIRLVTWNYMSGMTSDFVLSAEMKSVVGRREDHANEALHRPPFDDSALVHI